MIDLFRCCLDCVLFYFLSVFVGTLLLLLLDKCLSTSSDQAFILQTNPLSVSGSLRGSWDF